MVFWAITVDLFRDLLIRDLPRDRLERCLASECSIGLILGPQLGAEIPSMLKNPSGV